jgi:hypothetical protein
VGIALFSFVLRVAWRIVGGSATLRSFAVTYAYFAGVIGIISTVFLLLSIGIMRTFDRRSIISFSDLAGAWRV